MRLRHLIIICLTFLLFIGCSSDSKTLKISPKSHDFGTVPIGDYLEQDFILTNQYSDTLTISVLKVDGDPDFIIVSSVSIPVVMPAKSTYTVKVRFAPSDEGIQDAMLSIEHDKAPSKPLFISLEGSGQKVARIDIPEASYDFTIAVINIGKTHEFEVINVGTSELSLTAFNFVGPNASLFSITAGGNVPIDIAPGFNHKFTVQFLPIVSGNYSTTLQLSHNAVNGDNPAEIMIDGEGVDVNPMISLSKGTSWDFGSIATILSSTQICEIENIGTDPLTLSGATLASSLEFTVDSVKDGNGNVLNLPHQIPVAGKIYLAIKFAPVSATTYNDTLTLDHDGTNQPYSWDIPISGSGRNAQQKMWDVVTKSIDTWTVPTNITMVRIEVWGASGGGTGYGTPGKGARMRGDFNVSPGDVIEIAVGEQGLTGGQGGGGGGGSFVVIGSQPLIIAGGGGGAHTNNSTLYGKDGVITQTCTPHGATGSGYKSASGGGWTGDGLDGTYGALGGKSWAKGLIGGTCCTGGYSHWSRGDGGFGGGGGGSWAPGSAGGYNGGVSADCGGSQTPGGTGGGSINNGVNQDNTAGVQTGNGKVVITY